MKIVTLRTYNFDDKSERERIKSGFKGAQKKRLLEILDLFVAGKFQECLDKINVLGEDKEQECSEKEYLSMFYKEFFWDVKDYNLEVIKVENDL